MSSSILAIIPAIVLLTGIAKVQAQQSVTYETLAPILTEKCVMCHSSSSAAAGLRLDSFDALMKGGQKGPVVKVGEPATSELIRRLKGTSQPRMPMTGPPFLSEDQIAMFEHWIASGLKRGNAPAAQKPVNNTRPLPKPGEAVTYLHVAPIFAAHCVRCHTDGGIMGSAPEAYQLNSYEATLSAHDRVRVVPGKPLASELYRRIRGHALPRMPMDGPPYLSETESRLIETWIAQGARNTQGVAAPVPSGARVRLHGTLGSGWQLDGLPLIVGAGTRIDKSPRPGNYVQVRGHLARDGSVVVERLRRR